MLLHSILVLTCQTLPDRTTPYRASPRRAGLSVPCLIHPLLSSPHLPAIPSRAHPLVSYPDHTQPATHFPAFPYLAAQHLPCCTFPLLTMPKDNPRAPWQNPPRPEAKEVTLLAHVRFLRRSCRRCGKIQPPCIVHKTQHPYVRQLAKSQNTEARIS